MEWAGRFRQMVHGRARRSTSPSSAPSADRQPEWLRGHAAVLGQSAELLALALACEQPGILDDLTHSLGDPDFGHKLVHLLLFREPGSGHLLAAVVLYEYTVLGLPTGIFISPDTEGERGILAPAPLRQEYAWRAAAAVLLHGRGSLMLLSLLDADFAGRAALEDAFRTRATMRRQFRHRLVLRETLDGTLAQFGPRTRRNLRAAMRRAALREAIEFVPVADLAEADFLTMVQGGAYAVRDSVARWRYRTARASGLLAGLRRNGEWLALLGGRRRSGSTVVDWQVNRTNLPHLSLGLTMRGFLLEHEIARGCREIQFEGGTSHPMRSGFVEQTTGYALLGTRWMTPVVVRHVVRRLLPEQSLFNTWLAWNDLAWHDAGTP